MSEQLNLLSTQENQYIVWKMDEYTWTEINRAILHYQERTNQRPGLIAFRAGDRNKIKPHLPTRFELGEWVTDAVLPGHIWICSANMANYWDSLDCSYSKGGV